jgi:hypothetical protein
MGFIYKDIPAFNLAPGDTLAFDLGQLNTSAVELDIELAATTLNGGDVPALPFVKVVSNTHTPLNPNGDTIVGDYRAALGLSEFHELVLSFLDAK